MQTTCVCAVCITMHTYAVVYTVCLTHCGPVTQQLVVSFAACRYVAAPALVDLRLLASVDAAAADEDRRCGADGPRSPDSHKPSPHGQAGGRVAGWPRRGGVAALGPHAVSNAAALVHAALLFPALQVLEVTHLPPAASELVRATLGSAGLAQACHPGSGGSPRDGGGACAAATHAVRPTLSVRMAALACNERCSVSQELPLCSAVVRVPVTLRCMSQRAAVQAFAEHAASIEVWNLCCLADAQRAAAAHDSRPGAMAAVRAAARSSGPARHTALHVAALEGCPALARLLLRLGAALNARSKSGATPLFSACEAGHPGVVRVLLAAGADMWIPTASHENCLYIAALKGNGAVRPGALSSRSGLLPAGNVLACWRWLFP